MCSLVMLSIAPEMGAHRDVSVCATTEELVLHHHCVIVLLPLLNRSCRAQPVQVR